MKTLIIGAKGMLGNELSKVFAKYNPTLWSRDDIDISDKEQVDKKIGELAPELIINAAAYTAVDKCEENEEIATKVNGEAVGYLAKIAKKLGSTLVHYSTDYVFDGTKKEGYVESDTPSPASAYGRSKLQGEKQILKQVQDDGSEFKYYIIRTAWLFGPEGKNFVETMLFLAHQGKEIKVVDDQFGSPTYAPDLAKATLEIVENKKPSGIYHRTNDGQCSWYQFAKEIFKVFDKKVDLSSCSAEEYPMPAKRPEYSVLISTKLPVMRSWKSALEDYKISCHSDRNESL